MSYTGNEEPTHALPKELVAKLAEAREWNNRRTELDEAIMRSNGPGAAQRNQDDRDASDRLGALILEEIVEIIEGTWGFA